MAGGPPKKALAIRLRLGGAGKKYQDGPRKNGQLSPLSGGSLKGSRSPSENPAGSSDDSDTEPQRKSPLGPLDTRMIVRKPRTKMRRAPAKHVKAAAALIGVNKPPRKRNPLPSPRKPAGKPKASTPAMDEPDFLSLLAEAGEKLERDSNDCKELVDAEASAKAVKAAAQPSWKQRAKQSEEARASSREVEETLDAGSSGATEEQKTGVKGGDDGGLQKGGFKYRLEQKRRLLRNKSPAKDEVAKPRSEGTEVSRPVDTETRKPGTSAPDQSPPIMRKQDAKPARMTPSGRPNSLLQRLKEKASGGAAGVSKSRGGSGSLQGSGSRKLGFPAEMPAPAPRPAAERHISPDGDAEVLPRPFVAHAALAKTEDMSRKEHKPRQELPPMDDDDSDGVDSTEDEDAYADRGGDQSPDSDNGDPDAKRARSGDEEEEAKRLRRMEANREAARQTIRRKRAHYELMLSKEKALEQANNSLFLDIKQVRHEVDALQGTIGYLQSLLENASEEDHEDRLRIWHAMQNEQNRLDEHRDSMKSRLADELRRPDTNSERSKDDKIRAFEDGRAPSCEAEDDLHRRRSDEDRRSAEARHSEERRRDPARRSNNLRDSGKGNGHSPSEWAFRRQGGPDRGHSRMPPTSGPPGFPPDMAALFAAGGMPPPGMPPPGMFPMPGMMPPMPTPEQMQAMAQSGCPPPWMAMPPELAAQLASQGGRPGPGGMSQQEAEATMHALASGAIPDMHPGMMQDLPPSMRGMPPEMIARMMQGFPMHPGGPPGMRPPGSYRSEKAGPRPLPPHGPKP
mmetsp:Transcript_17337/g.45053  ORF Transcript_17337/g.45053 Transcript_17337/m.45053 type:complete len:794 (-) Transcript_17337:94-2475(-)